MPYSIYGLYGVAQYVRTDLAERLHRTALQLAGDGAASLGLSTQPGTFLDDFAFALAITATYAANKLEEADRQRFARTVSSLLDEVEKDWGLQADPTLSFWQRKRRLAARKKAARGATRPSVETLLQTLLGDNYLGIHVTRPNEVVLFPAALGDQPQNLQAPDIDRKLVRFPLPITTGLGSPQWVAYQPVDPVDPDGGHTVRIGDSVVVQPETWAQTETVQVADVDVDQDGSSPTYGSLIFQATFAKAHDIGVIGSVQPYGVRASSQRCILVVIKSAAALDPETRRIVHEELGRALPTVTTWAIVEATGPMQAGPFILDQSPMNATPFGVVTVP